MASLTHSRSLVLLSALAMLAGCSAETAERESPDNPTTPSPTESSTPPPPDIPGPFHVADCVDFDETWVRLDCEDPHQYQVFHAGEYPADVGDEYPPQAGTTASRACRSELPDFVGSTDVPATRLISRSAWPSEQQWAAGDRWFLCIVVERLGSDEVVVRTGSLADVLADGLGEFQRCLVGEPLDDEPTEIVPCDQEHRSEAVPGVLELSELTDPAETTQDAADDVIEFVLPHCEEAVAAYLGGDPEGIRPRGLAPLPDQWEEGITTAVCYAVSDTPVVGTMAE